MDSDLDDTCVLNFLIQQSEKPDDYRHLAHQISTLPTQNGLYFTWVRPSRKSENDIDVCVNINVIRFLSFNGVKCLKTIKALKDVLESDASFGNTIYYQSAWALLYFLSTLPTPLKQQLVTHDNLMNLLSHRETSNSVDKAMRLYCLASAGIKSADAEELVIDLLELQSVTGEWPSQAVFRAFNFWGSSDLTTALCIQAMQRYHELLNNNES